MPRLANTFGHRAHTVSTDQGSSRMLNETSLSGHASLKDWASVRILCGIHTTARIFKQVPGIADPDIKGMSLFLKLGAEMQRFR